MHGDCESLGGLRRAGRRVSVRDGKGIFRVVDQGSVEATVNGHRGGHHLDDTLRSGSCHREAGAHVRAHVGPARQWWPKLLVA